MQGKPEEFSLVLSDQFSAWLGKCTLVSHTTLSDLPVHVYMSTQGNGSCCSSWLKNFNILYKDLTDLITQENVTNFNLLLYVSIKGIT